MGERMKLSEL